MTSQLDPEAQALLEVMNAFGAAPLHTMSVQEARQRMRATLSSRGEPIELESVQDVLVPSPHGGLGVRLYRPSVGVLPVALFLHGGGWTLNDLDTHDELCRRLARRSGWLLASLDYRRAPEHKHPAALEDAYVAYRWLLDNHQRISCDPLVRAVTGESAGATTAAALSLLLRDLGAPKPTFQALAYPLMDLPGRWPSYAERGSGYTLDSDLVQWFIDQCLAPAHDRADPTLFPLQASDASGLPPTLVMTAEFDPLRDEGIAYANKLAAAGVTVEHIHAADQMHGFLLLGKAVRRAGELADRFADGLAAHHAAQSA
ncbi:MAG TPA: alpha/beta hydrolase [Solirubrobacteraceae bacterium]